MSEEKRRGRPRGYDPDRALEAARDLFWGAGFSATSLDALSAATGMNRPSIYAAFGDKEQLYLATLDRYRDFTLAEIARTLVDKTLREGLEQLYARAIEVYLAGGGRGCLLVSTATTEAPTHPAVRAALGDSLAAFDDLAAGRFAKAMSTGEIPAGRDPVALGRLAMSQMFALSVRARAGAGRAELEALAEAAVAVLAG